jgi:hypothetical protein
MLRTGVYRPELVNRMAAIYKAAVKELNLERATAAERERLAFCILSIAKSLEDPNRILDRALRMYQRGTPRKAMLHVSGLNRRFPQSTLTT